LKLSWSKRRKEKMNKRKETHIAATDSKRKRENARMKKEKDPIKLQTSMMLRSKRRTI